MGYLNTINNNKSLSFGLNFFFLGGGGGFGGEDAAPAMVLAGEAAFTGTEDLHP